MLPPIKSKDMRAYIIIPGINSNPKDPRNWAPEMTSDINILCDHAKADEFRYLSDAVFRRINLQKQVGFVIDLAHRYYISGYDPILVGHSNGCEIIRRAIIKGPSILKAAHLIAAACESDFKKNGLNAALRDGKVGTIHLYISKGDSVLNGMARLSKRLFSWMGLGYGTLGYDGPKNIPLALNDRVTLDPRHSFTHGQWFEGAHWQETMRAITRLEPL